MRTLVILLAIAALWAPLRAWGDEPAVLPGVGDWEGPGAWRVSAGILWGSAVALREGMPFGVTVDGFRRVGTTPFLWGARLAWTSTTEANRAWVLRHDHVAAVALGRVEEAFGPGLLYAQAGVGVMPVFERARRHQYERLAQMGLEDVERRRASVGPWALVEAGVGVRVRGGLAATVGAGPTYALQKVDGQVRGRLGFQTMLGISHAF